MSAPPAPDRNSGLAAARNQGGRDRGDRLGRGYIFLAMASDSVGDFMRLAQIRHSLLLRELIDSILREALSTEEGREMLEEALRDKLNDLDDEDDSPSRGGREG